VLPPSKFELPFGFIKGDAKRFNAVSSGFRYFLTKFKDDYDVISALGSPSEFIRNRNERVSWYCLSPNREAFDLYDLRMKELSFNRRMINHLLLSSFKVSESLVVPKLEQILTCSEMVKARIGKYLNRSDVRVIPLGVDCESFTNEGYDKYFFYPSRIIPEKQFEFAIEAFRLFSKSHKGWKLIIGGGLSDSYRDQIYFYKLKRLSNGLDIEFKLNLSDVEMKKLYANCYAVLFSGLKEDFGLVILEAMASQKSVIAVSDGGASEIICAGKTGFLVGSSVDMSVRMMELVEYPNVNETVGHSGRNLVQRDYTWKSFLDKVESSWKEVAKQ
jgi:glycosyltransferase involved in cell wall biosynthesis